MTDDNGTLTIVTTDDDPSVLRLRGEIDGETCEALERVVGGPADTGRTVVLDLSEVVFVDSAGLRTMVALERRARAAGGSLQLRRPSRAIARLLELTALDRHFDVRDA